MIASQGWIDTTKPHNLIKKIKWLQISLIKSYILFYLTYTGLYQGGWYVNRRMLAVGVVYRHIHLHYIVRFLPGKEHEYLYIYHMLQNNNLYWRMQFSGKPRPSIIITIKGNAKKMCTCYNYNQMDNSVKEFSG